MNVCFLYTGKTNNRPFWGFFQEASTFLDPCWIQKSKMVAWWDSFSVHCEEEGERGHFRAYEITVRKNIGACFEDYPDAVTVEYLYWTRQ